MDQTAPLATKTRERPRKFERLCVQISEMAHQLGPEAKLPTMTQLRDTLGVSVATLSSALRELEAGDIIYRRHGVGIYVSPRLSQKAICLICDPSFFTGGASPFWDLLVEGARQRAAEGGEAFSFHLGRPYGHPSPPLQEGLMADIRAGRVDGVFCLGLDREAISWLAAQAVPTVIFAGAATWTVNLDGEEGIRLAVRELAAQGCRTIGFWRAAGPPRPGDTPSAEPDAETRAFLQTLAAHGLSDDPRLEYNNRHRSHLTKPEQGYLTAMEVLEAHDRPRPDAVYIGDDLLTQGALAAMRRLDVRPGRDLRVASHANLHSPVLLGQEEGLRLIEIDPAEVVREMFGMLETLMDGRAPADPHVLVKPKVRHPTTILEKP